MHAEAEEAKNKKASAYAEKQRQKQEERERKEKEIEDEVKRLAEEKKKKEEEEFNEWKDMFSVEGTGAETTDKEDPRLSLENFIAVIKKRKVAQIEDLANEFKMKASDVVKRIEALESNKLLTGIMDDRGKYIYVSEEELGKVARFIKRKGRVSITDIVNESNRLIDLNPQEDAPLPVIDLNLDDDGPAPSSSSGSSTSSSPSATSATVTSPS